jgi:hypothetical protein
MSQDEYARLQAAMGTRSVAVGSVHWRVVRPLFYRPLLPFVRLEAGAAKLPRLAWLGCAQYAVTEPADADSCIAILAFENLGAYRPESLEKKLRYQIRKAESRFEIRPIQSAEELGQQGYPVYCSFLQRTNYLFDRRRRERGRFTEWSRALFSFPQVLVLGAYEDGVLRAVSVTYQVEDILCYATFFAESESLRHFVSDAMLHAVRSLATRAPSARLMFAGMRGMGRGLDHYYIHRGASVLELPARISGNRLAPLVLRFLAPATHRRLLGRHLPVGAAGGTGQ